MSDTNHVIGHGLVQELALTIPLNEQDRLVVAQALQNAYRLGRESAAKCIEGFAAVDHFDVSVLDQPIGLHTVGEWFEIHAIPKIANSVRGHKNGKDSPNPTE